jgi:SNF2-related domain
VVFAALGVALALHGKRAVRPRALNPAGRVHRIPGYHAAALVSLADGHGLRVSDQARQYAADTAARHEANRAAAGAFEAEPVPVPGLAAGLALKAQQYPVVRFAREHRRVMIGDDMGWGKTLSSLAAVAADGAYPVVVVCRPSLTLNWVAEITRFFPGLTVTEAKGTTPQAGRTSSSSGRPRWPPGPAKPAMAASSSAGSKSSKKPGRGH